MSDLISRQAAIDALQKEINKGIPPFDDVIGSIRCGVRLARNIIEDLPSAQPEIIRCNDCKYFERRSIYHHGLCDVHCNGVGEKEVTSEGQYCSLAERKEEND